MSFVDMNGEVRWTPEMRNMRVEQNTARAVPLERERVLKRRMLQIFIPPAKAYLDGVPPPTDGSDDPLAANRFFVNTAAPLCKPLTMAQAVEALQAAQAFLEADLYAEAADADIALLHARLDYDAARRDLAALPPVAPTDGTDDPLDPDTRAQVEAQRTDLQAQLDAASPELLAEVARHDAWVAAQQPPDPPPDPAPSDPPPDQGAPA